MEQVLKLNEHLARLVINEPLLLPDDLIIHISHVGYDLSTAFITLKNGEKKDKFKLTNPFNIPKDFLFSGRLFIGIDAYHKEELYKHWDTVPIKIVDTGESSLYLFDELEALNKKMTDLATKLIGKFNDLAEKHNVLSETIKEIKENY